VTAHNQIGYVHFWHGEYKSAVDAINKYIAVAPNEPNPYDTRAELYASIGELDSAIAMCRKALSIDSTFVMSIDKLGVFYLFAGKSHEAESLYQAAGAKFRAHVLLIKVHQGKFREALRLADDCMAANRLDGKEWRNQYLFAFKGGVYDYLGRWDSAAAYGRLSEKLRAELTPADTGSIFDAYFIRWYYLAGDTVGALRLLQRMSSMAGLRYRLRHSEPVSRYLQAMGEFTLAKKDYAHAIEHYSRADSTFVQPAVLYRLAESYLGAGDSSSAVSVLERLFKDYYELWCSGPQISSSAVIWSNGRASCVLM
jgi:tetratricopeptide (TPR) repeat protein